MHVSKALPYLLSLDASSTSVYCNAGFPAQDQSAEGQIINSELILKGREHQHSVGVKIHADLLQHIPST